MHTLQRNQASVNSQISDFLSAEPRYPAIVNKMRLPPGMFADFARNHPLTPDVKGSRLAAPPSPSVSVPKWPPFPAENPQLNGIRRGGCSSEIPANPTGTFMICRRRV